ncbi:MAG: dihydrofolate reductase [Alphaproteobacteria bacterium]|nr:dihydrofolate reductase [Alphaproteobacteria bacterium]
MNKIALWCRDLDHLIGNQNALPWHLPEDLKRFKKITLNQTLIMGKKTYESLPNRTLPKRKLIILTQDPNYAVSDSENHSTAYIKNNKIHLHTEKEKASLDNDLYIIGGAEIYKLFMTTPELQPEYIIETIYNTHHPKHTISGIFLNPEIQKNLDKNYTQQLISRTKEPALNVLLWTHKNAPENKDLLKKIKGISNE